MEGDAVMIEVGLDDSENEKLGLREQIREGSA